MKLSHLLLTVVAAATLTACGNLSNVSAEGTSDDLKWPQVDKSKFNHDGNQFGSWPNWDNVRMMQPGLNKDQIYSLLGRPHFNEGLFGVREWNYVFNYNEEGVHKTCQYKVLFDKDMNAQSFFWYPNGCGSASFNLGGDFLFDFDKDNLTPKSTEVLDHIANRLKSSNVAEVKVEGYTDRLGATQYNLDLSQRRADIVKDYLAAQGVQANITTVGLGEANQVVSCKDKHNRKELIECLRPNRRVVISADGLEQTMEAGQIGPAPLYQK